jgi:DNA replication protein DnaC
MTTPNGLGPLLTLNGLTHADLTDTTGDPYSDAEVLNRNILRMTELVPSRYSEASPQLEQTRSWVWRLRDSAKRADATDRKHIHRGPSLMLLGRTGCGKTHEAYGALWLLATNPVVMKIEAVSAPDLYAAMRPRFGVDAEAVFDRYAKATVLFVDDLGAAKATEWTEEVTYRLVNFRYENEMPTLLTSNVPPQGLAGALGERVASRLTEIAERVVMDGADRRYEGAA